MSKVTELKADMVPASVPTPPIPANLGREIPSLHCHIQPIMPLVFDDSLTFYECLAKCTAYVNAIGEQINGLTDGVKIFLEYMVKWGEELDAQWVQYQADLNKAWADYKNVINGQITDLENSWQAYQTNLNQQWQTFKNQYLDEWDRYKTDFQQEWQDFKNSIETTIEGQVLAWMTDNAQSTIDKWLSDNGVPGWSVYDTLSVDVSGGEFRNGKCTFYRSDSLKLIMAVYDVGFTINNPNSFAVSIKSNYSDIKPAPDNSFTQWGVILNKSVNIYNDNSRLFVANIMAQRLAGTLNLQTGPLNVAGATNGTITGTSLIMFSPI